MLGSVFVQVILLWSILTFAPPSYGTVQFPAWGLALGWCILAAVLLWIPAAAAYKWTRAEGSVLKVGLMPLRGMRTFDGFKAAAPFLWLNAAALFTASEDVMLS